MIKLTGGTWKGRNIQTPPGKNTRPSASMVRQALFNIVGHNLTGKSFLDLYAGSGALGLEAASRGAASVVLVERDASACKIIAQNVELLKANSVLLAQNSVDSWLSQNVRKFDVVFADPPFVEAYPEPFHLQLLNPGGVMVYQAPARKYPTWMNSSSKIHKYGESVLVFYFEV
jgi:16S rRNA (guanine966-N2)-methyltransferase